MTTISKFDIKICGLRDPVSIEAAIEGGATHIGFIFFPKSPRNIAPDDAGILSRTIADRIKKVAVSVDASNAFLDEIVSQVKPDLLQLHGSESIQRAKDIKQRYGLPVMKAITINTESDFAGLETWDGVAERLVFDAKPPMNSELPGGNGVSFDWKLLANWHEEQSIKLNASFKQLDSQLPPMLSGGINQNNIVEAIRQSKARAIDLSSGVETSPGQKDPRKIKALLETIAKLV